MMGKVSYAIQQDVNDLDALHKAGCIPGKFIFCENRAEDN